MIQEQQERDTQSSPVLSRSDRDSSIVRRSLQGESPTPSEPYQRAPSETSEASHRQRRTDQRSSPIPLRNPSESNADATRNDLPHSEAPQGRFRADTDVKYQSSHQHRRDHQMDAATAPSIHSETYSASDKSGRGSIKSGRSSWESWKDSDSDLQRADQTGATEGSTRGNSSHLDPHETSQEEPKVTSREKASLASGARRDGSARPNSSAIGSKPITPGNPSVESLHPAEVDTGPRPNVNRSRFSRLKHESSSSTSDPDIHRKDRVAHERDKIRRSRMPSYNDKYDPNLAYPDDKSSSAGRSSTSDVDESRTSNDTTRVLLDGIPVADGTGRRGRNN